MTLNVPEYIPMPHVNRTGPVFVGVNVMTFSPIFNASMMLYAGMRILAAQVYELSESMIHFTGIPFFMVSAFGKYPFTACFMLTICSPSTIRTGAAVCALSPPELNDGNGIPLKL